jgi:glutamate transport system substrate-binding protein
MRRVGAVAVAVLALGLAAGCQDPERVRFPAGTTMARLQDADAITVGVKYDQPGVGFRNLATGKLEGFDIEIAKIVARRLGIDDDRIRWVPTVSKNRVPYLQSGQVDIVVASFSITPERRAQVGQAGPYFVAGQQLLVRKAEDRITGPELLAGFKVCSVTDSTSLATVQRRYAAKPVRVATYTECVRMLLGSSVDAVTTDDAILLGYVGQQPDKLKVVGQPFTTERYGIGYQRGDREFCQFLTETIRLAKNDGSWADAFARTLGRAGVPMPPAPEPEPCAD